MHVQPVLNGLRASLETQRSLAGHESGMGEAISALVDALGPALRLAAMELAQQAAAEVDAQLDDRRVEVVIVDGDPALRVTDATAVRDAAYEPPEDFDARITLRLPPSLKQLIEDSAAIDGDSVNAWVVDALGKRAKRVDRRGRRVTEGFDL